MEPNASFSRRVRSTLARTRPADAAALLYLLGIVLLVTHLYTAAEHALYFWDRAVFREIAARTASALQSSVGTGLRAVERSFADDYNALFALPLVPFLWTFGESRHTFELAAAVVYLCPLVLSIAAVAVMVYGGSRRRIAYTAGAVALLVPMTWVPLLRGYPDAGGAVMVLLAVLLLLRDPDLRRWRSAALVGACLAIAAIFRRHFAYAAVSFYLAAAIHGVTRDLVRGGAAREKWGAVAYRSIRLAFSSLALLGTLALLAGRFLQVLLSVDYKALYESYELSPGATAAWYVPAYGWLLLLAAGCGLVLAFFGSSVDRGRLAFVTLFGATSASCWCLVARQVGKQYTYQITPLVVLGLVGLVEAARRVELRALRVSALVAVSVLLGATAALGLTGIDHPWLRPLQPMLVADWGPVSRSDMAEVQRLLGYLRGVARADDGVLVVASSHVINQDMLRRAERRFFGRENARLRFLTAREVDSRDPYPLRELLEAEYVVQVEPCQLHLPPESQDVVRLACELFASKTEFAQDFVRQPVSFALVEGARASVLRRRRPTRLATALRTLDLIERRLPERSPSQPDWVVVNRRFVSWLYRNADGTTYWAAHPAEWDGRPTTAAAYVGSADGAIVIAGSIRFTDDRCSGATVAWSAIDAKGELQRLAEIQRRPGEDAQFRLDLDRPRTGTLLMQVLPLSPTAPIDYCLLVLDSLSTERRGS